MPSELSISVVFWDVEVAQMTTKPHSKASGTASRQYKSANHKVVLSHWSALWYYRFSNIGLLPLPYACDDHSLDNATANLTCLTDKDVNLLSVSTADLAAHGIYVENDVREARRLLGREHDMEALSIATDNPYKIELPGGIDALVGKGAHRGTRENIRAHQHSRPLAKHSLRRIGDNLYIVSPKLMFVQMAYLLKEPHLVAALATEIAGSYALLPIGLVNCKEILLRGEDPFDSSGHLKGDGYCETLPLATVEELRGFVERAKYLHGTDAASKGLSASVNGSASPLETVIDVSLALIRNWGGAGCGLPEANKDVPLNEEGRKITGKRKAIADALFTNKNGKRIDVEPGGQAWHSGKDAMVKDNDRRIALEHQRIEVIVVPWKTFKDPVAWMHICNRIANHLGKNFHAPTFKMMERWNHVHDDFCDTDLLKRPPLSR